MIAESIEINVVAEDEEQMRAFKRGLVEWLRGITVVNVQTVFRITHIELFSDHEEPTAADLGVLT